MTDERAGSAPLSRVLMIAPTPFFGDRGCHVRIYEETRALAAAGVRTLVTTYPAGRYVPGIDLVRSPALPGVRPSALGPSWSRPILDAGLLWTTLQTTRRFRPQILHAHLHEGILIATLVRRLTGIPVVADVQGSLTAELIDHGFISADGRSQAMLQRLERWLVAQPDRLVVSSAAGAGLLAAQGVRPDRIASLPDGVDLGVFRPMAADPELLRQLRLAGRRIVVFLGVLTPYQGVDLLLAAVPQVLSRVPDAHFLVMGYPNEERYRAIARNRGLDNAVTLPGRIPYAEAPRWLSLGQVAVSAKSSTTEANGKLLNYMACGLPVIATDTPVNRELLGNHGVYVPVGDPGALSRALIEVLETPELGAARGAVLRRRAEEQFSWPSLIQQLLTVYGAVRAGAKWKTAVRSK